MTIKEAEKAMRRRTIDETQRMVKDFTPPLALFFQRIASQGAVIEALQAAQKETHKRLLKLEEGK